MGLFSIYLEDLSRLTSVQTLDHPDALAYREDLAQLFGSDLDFDRYFVQCHQRGDESLADLLDCSSATLELSLEHLASVSDLDPQLRVIAHSLQQSVVLKDVPLIDVRRVAAVVFKKGQVKLEPAHFVDHWAHVLMLQLRYRELMVKEPVAELKVPPHVHFLAKKPVVFQSSLSFDQFWIEEALGDLDVALVLDHLVHGVNSTTAPEFATIFISVQPRVWDARDQPHQGLFRPNDFFDKAQVVTERSLVNPDPLVRLHGRLLHLAAGFHDLGHLSDWDHATASGVDACHPSRQLLHMGQFVGLHKDDALSVLGLEDLHDHQRVPIVEMVDQLVRQSHHELALHPWLDLQAPKLRVHVGGEIDLTGEGSLVDIHCVVVAIVGVLSELNVILDQVFILDLDPLFTLEPFFQPLDHVADRFRLPCELILGVGF